MVPFFLSSPCFCNTMIYTIFLLGLIVAGFVVVFTKLREETWLDKAVDVLPENIQQAIRCPLCLGYWLSLLAVILIDPLAGWSIPWRIGAGFALLDGLFRILAGWFAVGLVTSFWRMGYRLLWKTSLFMAVTADDLHDRIHKH